MELEDFVFGFALREGWKRKSFCGVYAAKDCSEQPGRRQLMVSDLKNFPPPARPKIIIHYPLSIVN